jgi:hypothetical protein
VDLRPLQDLYCAARNWNFIQGNETQAESPCFFVRQQRAISKPIELYGPDQLVLVDTRGNSSVENWLPLSSPQTLRACLVLPYITRGVVVHGVPRPTHEEGNRVIEEFGMAKWTRDIYRKNKTYFVGLQTIYTPEDSGQDVLGRCRGERA